ncbi:uncharacterized protein LOC107409478 [Ziziphus jujuba]|uniref:Uncharacterized protein LOC107409478 n=1 Tax=Ziziphus jujuba TaxID=326968 RepID=A0A6P3ZC32_ZIZJJ|nr:uncharacterized protein LOC107409478 [Ziziphus jujuba]XP_048328993.1 uncharacterized protein LOC107409478 [Ziziphus jujuba]XP_048328994.1 uncharacterized protein LOC107409478 [Ziziphus jujuba]XP_060670130.1 uncharacterized protein LOC107409478 [Ziziphus jujuba]
MIINMCSETSPPRISFSYDLGPEDDEDDQPVLEQKQSRRDTSLLDSNSDFDFSFTSSCYGHESSSADELFSHGVILPTKPRERVCSPKRRKDNEKNPRLPSLPPLPSPKKDGEKEAMVVSSDIEQKPPQSSNKSFWGFKRSSSLNYDNKRSLLCSLPLLLRSNSTGSVSNSKRSLFKDFNKHGSKQPSISLSKSASVSSSSSSSSSFYSTSNPYPVLHKPPLKKNNGGGGSYGNGVRIIPVINVPPPYISKGTAKFFGLGSFLHPGKDKKTKK